MAGGGKYSLALRRDGIVVAWGDNFNGQINVPPGLANVHAIAAGGGTCFALVSDGSTLSSLQVFDPALAQNIFSMSLTASRGRSYRPEFTDSVVKPNWTMLPPVPGNGTIRTLTDSPANVPQRFYRVRQQP
ncbi:MAG: RCC1 domain-containing protein [Verrucomicrobiota bacterium]